MTLVDRGLLLFVVVSAFFALNDSLYSDHIPCKPTYCACSFPDGQGIDLKKLKTYNFSANPIDGVDDYQFHLKLCGNDTITVNNSTNCTASLYRLKYNKTEVTECLSFGSSKEFKFVWPRIVDTPYLEYKTENRTSHVHLICDTGVENKLFIKPMTDDSIYNFDLVGKDVCLESMSGPGGGGGKGGGGGGGTTGGGGGTTFGHVVGVIFIILLVLFLLYMIVGMLVLKFIRGAEGVEVIPNHEFWTSVPNRMKNLLLFCAAGCKSPPTYDRI